MADFLETRIAGTVSFGSSYSDEYAVEIVRTASGARFSRLRHGYPVRRFRLDFREPLSDMWEDIVSLYHSVRGQYAGFRVKAVDDFTTAADGRSAPTKDDQPLAYVSSGIYQLQKAYGLVSPVLGIGRPVRTIYKPVTGTTLIAKNGVLLSSGVTVNTTTGRVTISPAPSHPADVITGGCEFDIPVAFAKPIDIEQHAPYVRLIGAVELEELLTP